MLEMKKKTWHLSKIKRIICPFIGLDSKYIVRNKIKKRIYKVEDLELIRLAREPPRTNMQWIPDIDVPIRILVQ